MQEVPPGDTTHLYLRFAVDGSMDNAHHYCILGCPMSTFYHTQATYIGHSAALRRAPVRSSFNQTPFASSWV